MRIPKLMTMIITLALMVGVAALPAEAQTVKKSTLSGIVTSASASVPDLSSVTLMTTPATGFFVLLQYCAEDPGRVILSGNTLGTIVPGPDECVSYSPGIAIPQGETLTLTDDGGGPQQAMITGILSKK